MREGGRKVGVREGGREEGRREGGREVRGAHVSGLKCSLSALTQPQRKGE